MHTIIRFATFALLQSFSTFASEPESVSNVYSSYQNSTYCNPEFPIAHPTSLEEVVDIVKSAAQSGITVKAFGSLHSTPDIICTHGIPISMKGIAYVLDNEDGDTVTFGAGLEVQKALEYLQSKGKSLVQVLTYGGVTIGGAVGTGAHGSSLRHPAAIADQVVGLTVVDGQGVVRNLTDPEELRAWRVNLGLLGVVVDVTLRTVPLYKMTVENSPHSESILLDGTALAWAQQYDFFQIFWFPSIKEVVVTQGVYTNDLSKPGTAITNFIPNLGNTVKSVAGAGLEALHSTRFYQGLAAIEMYSAASLVSDVMGKPPIFTEDGETLVNPATGWGWSLQTNMCNGSSCGWMHGSEPPRGAISFEELTFGVDLASFPSVISMIKGVLTRFPATFELTGIYLRFLKESDSHLSLSSGRPTFVIEIPMFVRDDRFRTARAGLAAYQAIAQKLVNDFGGRPHWGKNGLAFFSEPVFNKSFPDFNRGAFSTAMETYDPHRIFMNRFGERLAGTSFQRDVNPAVTHCALQDYCLCGSNEDCAVGQECIIFEETSVCEDVIPSEASELLTSKDSASVGRNAMTNLTQVLSIMA